MKKVSSIKIIPAGKVLRTGRSNELISLCNEAIDASKDDHVYDSHGRDIGKIIAVVGRVNSPYLIAKPGKGVDSRKLIGSSIYLIRRGIKCQNKR